MSNRRTPLLAASALGVGALFALGAPLAASAHVTVEPSATSAGSYSVLSFAMGHGCEGSPTTSVTFTIPESITTVTPTVNPGWEIEKVMEPLDEPAESSHGDETTERVGQIVYTADTPLADGLRTTFDLQVRLPDDAAGQTILFPALQTCEVGETDWADEDPEAAAPAPSVTVTEASAEGGHGHGGEVADDSVDASSSAADAAAGTDDVLARVLGVLGLVVGVVGVILAVASRRRTTS